MSPVSSAGMIIRNAKMKAPPAATPRRITSGAPRRRPIWARARYRAVSVGTRANRPGATRLVSRNASNSASFSKPPRTSCTIWRHASSA